MNELYIVGCFVSLGFFLGIVLNSKNTKNYELSFFVIGSIIFWYLSWMGVVSVIIGGNAR